MATQELNKRNTRPRKGNHANLLLAGFTSDVVLLFSMTYKSLGDGGDEKESWLRNLHIMREAYWILPGSFLSSHIEFFNIFQSIYIYFRL